MDFRFSTYATWWINQAIGRAINTKDRTIRIPYWCAAKISKMRRKRRRLALDLGREPSNLEVARDLGWDVGDVELLAIIWQETTCLEQTVEELEHICDCSSCRPYSERPEASLDDAELRDCLERAFRRLLPREAHILRRRFGLNGTEKCSLITLGDELGLTRERIRQLESKAIQKLGLGPDRATLADFLYIEQNG